MILPELFWEKNKLGRISVTCKSTEKVLFSEKKPLHVLDLTKIAPNTLTQMFFMSLSEHKRR